jgi:hypothetical protein
VENRRTLPYSGVLSIRTRPRGPPVQRTLRLQSVLNLGPFSKAGCRVEDVNESKCWPKVKDGICQSRIAGVYKKTMFSTHFKTSPHGGRYGFKRGLQWNQSAARTALWPWRSRSSTMRNQVHRGSLLSSVRLISSPSRHYLARVVFAIPCSR